ncbi:MAG: hypothetical protein JST52_02760 [Bacteroidetes bacterium]|nr:hypothetical protein [Bacteroidota bacterium]
MSFRLSYRWFVAGVVLVHVAFFLLACHFKRIYMGDSYEYVFMALNIKEYGLFYASNTAWGIYPLYFTLRPPGYSLFLLLVYLFAVNNWAVLLLQNALSVFNIFLSRKVLLMSGFDRKYDGLLLLFIGAYPAQFIFANTLAPDLLLQTFVLCYVYFWINMIRETKSNWAWKMSLALLGAVFTKPIFYFFIPIHFLMLLYFGFKKKQRSRLLFPALIPIIVVLLYNSWNVQRTGKFHFTGIQPWNAMYYNVRMYQEQRLGKLLAAQYMQQEQQRWDSASTNFASWYEYGNHRAESFLKAHFFSYLWFHLKYSVQFFIHPGKGEIDLFTGRLTYGQFYKKDNKRIVEILKSTPVAQLPTFFKTHLSVVVMFLVLLFNFFKIVGVGIFLVDIKTSWAIKVALFSIPIYLALLTGPLANTRYHLPVSLLVIGCGVLGFQKLGQRKKILGNHSS